MRKSPDLETLDHMLSDAARRGVLQLDLDDAGLDGRIIRHLGQDLVNFGSCSYLGLEVDPRLKRAAIEAVERYGVHFSSSRTYLAVPLYRELESRLDRIFGAHALAVPTTTLGHMAALPVLVEEGDAVILDQQVHHSVQTATHLLRVKGVRVELLPHNRMDRLEALVTSLAAKHRRVWYLADGVYSMYGDLMPTAAVADLLDRHAAFHLYVDDAHGLSWAGPNGAGYVLGQMPWHPRMVLATSLGKGFGVGGGVLVFPDADLRRKVRTCGGPMIFSGPMEPAVLGAAIAAADLHLSPELGAMQAQLARRMRLCNDLMTARGLPLVAPSEAPIRFVGMGLPRVAYRMVRRLMEDGFYTNSAMFPAVPMRRAGVRLTLTLHQTEDDLRGLVEAMARHLPRALEEEGSTLEQIRRTFKLPEPVAAPVVPDVVRRVPVPSGLTLQHATSVEALDAAEWDRLLGHRGAFDAAGLRFLEATFRDQAEEASNWRFHYFVVRDGAGAPVLATFFTEALWKDDMVEAEAVSRHIEAVRAERPDFLTSRMLAMGSLLTEGDHLYLDRGGDWQGALKLLFEELVRLQERSGAAGIALRDLAADDPELDAFLRDQGYARASMPESLVLEDLAPGEADWWQSLSANSKRHQKRNVQPWNEAYHVEILRHGGRTPSAAELARFHALYRNVKERSLSLNTFDLPANLFSAMLEHPCWELVVLRLAPEPGGELLGEPVGVLAAFVGADHYAPMVIGLDYRYVVPRGLYRQFLRQMVRRAQAHGARRVYFGMDATFEKERFGAKARPGALYLQLSDHFQLEQLAQLRADALRA